MNRSIYIILVIITLIPCAHSQQPPSKSSDVEKIGLFDDLFHYRNYYISAQPEVERLTWLKDQGVRTIINLRSDEEKESFINEEYDEKFVAEKLGFTYIEIPIDGSGDYTPENLALFNRSIDPGTPTLIHCGSGSRATYFFVAYLVSTDGYPLNDAVDIGKMMEYSFPLESLLGKEIHMEISPER